MLLFLIKINLIMCHYYVSTILKYFLALLDKWLENFTCFGLLSNDDNYDFLPCDDIDGCERGPWSYSDSGKRSFIKDVINRGGGGYVKDDIT